MSLMNIALTISLLPLLGALIAGILGKKIGHRVTHFLLIGLMTIAFGLSCYLFKVFVLQHHQAVQESFYVWATAGNLSFDVSYLLDSLSASMMLVVIFVSLMVHIYTVGYMASDPGYTRFFSYVSLFTFAMLVLVLANNFLLLFFGWEAVGLVSYLLIGFWFKKDSANNGSLKAFLVNRVGDIGFILAIAAILLLFGTLTYQDVFAHAASFTQSTTEIFPNYSVNTLNLICFLLFFGAMGKSAQVPLHIWLPESMEGPTPISALIHAATMVTAGIYMVARMSPLFEYTPQILSLVLVIGGTTALFMGLVALVQNDIKRVIAYSTISQLGYMVVALGASAYDAAIFHLITHAFFKALLFLAAGSVIIAMHHEQDMRKMGGLARLLPVTYITFVIGALALSAIPPFSGFYSKDIIIEAAKVSQLPGATYAYICVLIAAFVTPFYIFRALFMTFHLGDRNNLQAKKSVFESPLVMLFPLIMLAIPSILAGQILIDPMIFAEHKFLSDAIFVLPEHNVLGHLKAHYPGALKMALSAGSTITFWLSLVGIVTAWLFIGVFPRWSQILIEKFSIIYSILINKYGLDELNQLIFVRGTRKVGQMFYHFTDLKIIDGIAVNGSGRLIRWFAQTSRSLQTGYIYHYALVMIIGILGLLVWFKWGF